MKRFRALMLMMSMALLLACSTGKVDEEALKAVLLNNFKALQEENLEGYLGTLHPESPGYAQMEKLCPRIFEIYDLQHQLIDFRVVEASDKEARIRTVQEARRLSGPENYRHNRSTTVHTLKKYQGQWKLFQTEQESVEYIE